MDQARKGTAGQGVESEKREVAGNVAEPSEGRVR
jgi:hypothetical protein